jgi:hypothetical protein
MEKQHRSSKSDSERMEEYLHKSSFNSSGDLSGWPPQEAPRSSRADSCGPSPAQPEKAIPVGQDPPKKGNAAKGSPVAAQPSKEGPADRGCVDGRGDGVQRDLVHGASYGGYVPTRRNSSLVDDDEAAARLEWEYQFRQRQSSRTHSRRDTGGRPRSRDRGYVPLSSLDPLQQGESRSSRDNTHMMDVMARMERQLAASTAAIATISAAHASTSGPGEYISLLLFELLKFRLYCSNFI